MRSETKSQLIRGILWVHHNGRTFSLAADGGKKARKKSGGAASDRIEAPMPGKITKILVAVGDSVQPGQAVLMMEAMKMEYTLKAEAAGSLESLNCQVGDQVILGKVLAKIKT